MTRWFGSGCLVFFLAHFALAADETYSLKLKEIKKGESVSVTRTENWEDSIELLNANGKIVEKEGTKESETETFWEQVLAIQPGKAPTSLRRGYGAARVTTDGKTKARVYEGKIVDIVRKKDGYEFSMNGKELADEDAEAMEREFKGGDAVVEWRQYLPGKPVKLEEAWNIKEGSWMTALEDLVQGHVAVNSAKAVARGQLLKVYKKDGRQYGTFVLHFEIPVKSYKVGKEERVGGKDDRVVDRRLIDACIDGTIHDISSKDTVHIDATSTFVDEGVKYTFKFQYRGTFEQSIREGAK